MYTLLSESVASRFQTKNKKIKNKNSIEITWLHATAIVNNELIGINWWKKFPSSLLTADLSSNQWTKKKKNMCGNCIRLKCLLFGCKRINFRINIHCWCCDKSSYIICAHLCVFLHICVFVNGVPTYYGGTI